MQVDSAVGRRAVRTAPAPAVLVALVALVVLASACSDSAPPTADGTPGVEASPFDGTYRAEIRRTDDGVPHVVASNWTSAMFGQGYASAEDDTCTLPDQILRVEGRRASTFGAGDDGENVASDFAWRAIGIGARAARDYDDERDDVKTSVDAFTAGWNRYLQVGGADGATGWCAGASWLVPVEPRQVYAYVRSIALLASSADLVEYLGSAQPPTVPAAPASLRTPTPTAEGTLASMRPVGEHAIGSNAWGIGSDRSAGGGGMLLANPHFPWEGPLRFWEVELIVPGELDLYGAQLVGLPGVSIGFTDQFAWSHTVSAGHRFTAYTLDLVPGQPTAYRYDGSARSMTSRDETVEVRQPDGTMSTVTRTLWASEYGPILALPGLGWTGTLAVTYRDANLDNRAFVRQMLDIDQARSLDEVIEVHRRDQGTAWVNTVAVGVDGQAWYADLAATPALSEAALEAYQASLEHVGVASIAAGLGFVVLNGSRSLNQWIDDPGARQPGLIAFDHLPQVERRDHVFNANGSFWLSNADHPLTGDFGPLVGAGATAQSPRTRQNARLLADLSATGPSGPDGRFDLDELRAVALANGGFVADELRAAVVERCRATTAVEVPARAAIGGSAAGPGGTVDLRTACDVLDHWDGRSDLSSRGAALWRELVSSYRPDDLEVAGALWARPFDPGDPVGTPSGLAPAPAAGPDPVLVRLGQAIQDLEAAGVALDAALGDVQHASLVGGTVAVHGGSDLEGVMNVVSWSPVPGTDGPVSTRPPAIGGGSSLGPGGYGVNSGTSFLLAVDLTSGGPHAVALLAYAPRDDPSGAATRAALDAFASKSWRTVVFGAGALAAATEVTTTVVSS